MTFDEATAAAQELLGPDAVVFTGADGFPCYVGDGSRFDGFLCAVGVGETWEEALQDAVAYMKAASKLRTNPIPKDC